MKYTHIGWFGICPVYLAGLEVGMPYVEPRRDIYIPLMTVSEVWYSVKFTVLRAINPDYVPMWPLLITGEVEDEHH